MSHCNFLQGPLIDEYQTCSIFGNFQNAFVCLPSIQHAGKAALVDDETKEQVGNLYQDLKSCQNGLGNERAKQICMPSNKYQGKFLIFNLKAKEPLRNKNYFLSKESCDSSIQNIIGGLVCLPSMRFENYQRYYMFDIHRLEALEESYNATQEQCFQSIMPIILDREHKCRQSSPDAHYLSVQSLDTL